VVKEHDPGVPPSKGKDGSQWKQLRLAVSKPSISVRNPTEEV